jgi:response regulator of citrate/malate metabolism
MYNADFGYYLVNFMQKILVFSADVELFLDVKESLEKNKKTEILLFQHSLELVNHFLSHYSPLVILDIDLLKNEIFEMIQVLKNIHVDAKIVLILSPENMPICSSVLSLGVVSYQLKPLTSGNVTEIISSILHFPVNH